MAVQRVTRLDSPRPSATGVPPATVLIVDDHPMMRQIIAFACEVSRHLEVIGESGDGSEALEMATLLAPDLIVLDMGLPGLTGVEVIRALREREISSRVLVLTGSVESSLAFECFRLDVDGYIDKLTPLDELMNIIEDVASGKRAVSMGAEHDASEGFGAFIKHQRELSRTDALLTERERAVLRMIGMAFTTSQMASRLGLSTRTVESHMAKLYKKLGVVNRSGALRKGASLGLIDDIGEVAHA